jgi:hypothetical protein
VRRLPFGHSSPRQAVEKFRDVVYELVAELPKFVAVNFQRRFAIS